MRKDLTSMSVLPVEYSKVLKFEQKDLSGAYSPLLELNEEQAERFKKSAKLGTNELFCLSNSLASSAVPLELKPREKHQTHWKFSDELFVNISVGQETVRIDYTVDVLPLQIEVSRNNQHIYTLTVKDANGQLVEEKHFNPAKVLWVKGVTKDVDVSLMNKLANLMTRSVKPKEDKLKELINSIIAAAESYKASSESSINSETANDFIINLKQLLDSHRLDIESIVEVVDDMFIYMRDNAEFTNTKPKAVTPSITTSNIFG